MAQRASYPAPMHADSPGMSKERESTASELKSSKRRFLIYVYFGALLVRLIAGGLIYYFDYSMFFAGDTWTYDYFGWGLAQYWARQLQHAHWVISHTSLLGFNGMFYWVAALYTVIGRSQYGATAIQCAITCLIPIIAYKIAYLIYGSVKAARYSALACAFLPSMVIWGCLLMKDPLILLLAGTTVLFTLKMQQGMKLRYVFMACVAMLLTFPLRSYVFYFMLLAVVGSLLMSRIGRGTTLGKYLLRLGGIGLIAITLFALGFDQIAKQQIDSRLFEQVQRSRQYSAQSAQSGFDSKSDVSNLKNAFAYLPRGIIYLLFAPFPWQAGSPRMMMAVPEMLLWYAFFPYFIIGIIYTVRRHFRKALVVFLFVTQLTCFYAVFLGNIGTAHRQRTQLFIFYAMFTAAGWVYSRRKARGIRGVIAD